MSPQPYYADSSVTLYHGDCREILPNLNVGSVDVLLTDPPYFRVKDDDWDNQWHKRDEFLAWLGNILDQVKPLLATSSSVWVFASPLMVRAVEDLVDERFRVLNSIRWVKTDSTHNRADVATLRRYAMAWEAIVLAEQRHDEYGEQTKALHAEVFAPIGRYIASERERSCLTRKELAARLSGYKNLDSATANVWNWELGKNLIGVVDYEAARGALGCGFLERDHDDLRLQWEALTCEYEHRRRLFEEHRRPFRLIRASGPVTDLWTFPQVESYPGKHPCEKPQSMLRHMVETSSKPGALVLDPFAGTGATLRACKELGRRAVGIELDERYCERAAERLAQETLVLLPGEPAGESSQDEPAVVDQMDLFSLVGTSRDDPPRVEVGTVRVQV